MNKRTNAAVNLTLILFFLVIGLGFFKDVSANPLPPYQYPDVKICSPLHDSVHGSNVNVYVKVVFRSYTYNSWDSLVSLNYSLAPQKNSTPMNLSYADTDSDVEGSATLTDLTDGSYTVYIAGESNLSGSIHYWSAQSTFLVDTIPPAISNSSIENKTYPWYQIPLAFTVNETTFWIGYSLDNQANQTITGNSTITVYHEGAHSLSLYANDTAGNMGKAGTVNFSVAIPASTPSYSPNLLTPTPTLAPAPSIPEFPSWMILQIVSIAALLAAIIIKRKRISLHASF